jgi:hypothetical protein
VHNLKTGTRYLKEQWWVKKKWIEWNAGLGTSDTSINSGVNQDFRAQTSSLSEMIWSFTNYPYVSKMPTIKYNWGSSVVIRNALILNNMYTIFNLKFRYYHVVSVSTLYRLDFKAAPIVWYLSFYFIIYIYKRLRKQKEQ